ncbi:MAG: aldehyde:ferredoxin oxidoreductase, partial [Spirochaetes bacterium GWC1_27_15]
MLKGDTLSNVLYIDLTKKDYRIENREDLFNKYLGGTGVGIQLLKENCPPGCDPLGPDNPIIFVVGPLTSFFPLASKTVAMFKSPHTGNLGESHCGGRTAVAIRMAGFGAIVIKGKSDIPIYLSITDNKVVFKNATTLWGMEHNSTTGKVIRENEKDAGLRTIMRIGRAGEKQISYACVTAETYRHFGRLGLGAVFGSKNLKALVASGKRSTSVEDTKKYISVYDEIYNAATESPLMKKYHELGTPENVLPLNKLGGLPTQNLQKSRFEGADQISGEAFAEKYLGRRLACSHCPVACIHIASLREPYEDEPYFYKTSMVCYDYEPIFALGSMLGGTDTKGILKLMDRIESWGLDVMSAGVVLAWVTEAYQKGLITNKETVDLKPEWNDYDTYIKILDNIIDQPNDFYKALGKGSDYASSVYGGKEFSLTFGKNEMPGYHTGPGAHLGFLIGTRHSHLDNAGYSIDQKVLITTKITGEELAKKVIDEEKWRQILTSLAICFFARGIYTEDVVLKALECAGFKLTKEDLKRIGEEIYTEKYKFKFQEGFSLDDYTLPKRIFETETPTGMIDPNYMKEAV